MLIMIVYIPTNLWTTKVKKNKRNLKGHRKQNFHAFQSKKNRRTIWLLWYKHLSVDNQITLSINHVGDHHYWIIFSIWKFQRQLCCFNIKSTNVNFSTLQEICPPLEFNSWTGYSNIIPLPTFYIWITQKSWMRQ